MSLEKNILEKIERDHLEVIPKWKFVAKEYGVRCLAFVFFAMGSVSWGAALYWVARHDKVGMYNLPYFWGALAAFFVAGIIYLFDKSDSLYKIRWTFALSSIGVLVFAGGYLSHATGAAKHVEEAMIETIPAYESMDTYQDDLEGAVEIEDEKNELETIVKNEQKKTSDFKVSDDLEEKDEDEEDNEKDDDECDEDKSCVKGAELKKVNSREKQEDNGKSESKEDDNDNKNQTDESRDTPENDEEDENDKKDESEEEQDQ